MKVSVITVVDMVILSVTTVVDMVILLMIVQKREEDPPRKIKGIQLLG